MKLHHLPALALAAVAAISQVNAETTATTDPVGFMTIQTPAGSDTIIAAPLTKAPVFQGAVSSVTDRVLTFSPSPEFSSLTTTPHYVQAADGSDAGKIFDVESNTTDSITLVDNGVSPAGLNGASVKVIPYWTLGEIYPAADQGTSFTPSGTTGLNRRTQILFPNIAGTGINRSAAGVYYFVTNAAAPLDPTQSYWRSAATGATNQNGTPILPDTYFTVRNPANAGTNLATTISGSVNTGATVVQLDSTGAANDNYVSLGRPVDIKLNDLGIVESGAFLASANTTGIARRDQLMIINNDTIGQNKSASSIYYYVTGQGWKSAATGSTDVGENVIPSAIGYIIRKAQQNPTGTTFWTNNITIAE